MTPKFITFEGVEGAGKSTQLECARYWLEQAGYSVMVTREPGGTELAEKIRQCLLEPVAEPMADLTELLLVFAARAQHLTTKIQPALADGFWVLCDRFTDATYAYQGAGRGLSNSVIANLESLLQPSLRPDATLLFDLPATVGLERAGKRQALDRIEQENVAFFERVRQCYLARAADEPSRFHTIDARAPETDVRHQVTAVLAQLVDVAS